MLCFRLGRSLACSFVDEIIIGANHGEWSSHRIARDTRVLSFGTLRKFNALADVEANLRVAKIRRSHIW